MRQRPIAVTVFGILNMGYALWKFLGALIGAVVARMNIGANPAMAALKNNPTYLLWNHISMAVAAVFGIMLIASGIGLLLLQNWARTLAMVYSVLEMIFVVASAIFTQLVIAPAMASQFHGSSAAFVEMSVKVGFVFGLLFGLAYPVLLLIFMTRPSVAEAFRLQASPIENPIA
jgi:uncharacterized protein with PQ loop repeat